MKHRYIILLLVAIFTLSFGNISYAQLDLGDAPDPSYPTLQMNNGAQHVVGPLFLGTRIDGELDGQPNSSASGDDANGLLDDEDGVTFSTWILPNQNASIVVTATGTGFLDAWIDFQANGNWTDSGDQIFMNQVITAGQNSLTFTVPSSAIAGTYTFARFRFSSNGGLLPTGMAPDGEVEDYQIVIGVPSVGNTVMDPDAGLSYTQNEISMAIEPVTSNIISAYNDTPWPGGPGIGVSYSTDNGQTWNSQQLNIPSSPITGINYIDAFDPTVTCDDAGNTFVAHISTDYNWSSGPESGLFVHKSTDGGISWSSPITVDTNSGAVSSPDTNYKFNDRCQIRADQNSSSPYYNNIYITWIKDRGWNMSQPYSDIYVSVSTDGGSSFLGAKQINSTSNAMGNMPIQAIANNGDLYVLWIDYHVGTGGNGVLLLDKSTDGAANWGTDIIVDTIALPSINLNDGTLAKGAAILRTDPANSSQLYIVYAADPDRTDTDEADIFFIKSTNSGTTWSSPLKLNDDATSSDQILPWMEVKSNGTIDVVWYDRRNDPNNLLWDVYLTNSIDGGTTFATNTKVNVTSFLTPLNNLGHWFGEYLGLAVSDSIAYIGFTSSAIDTKGDVFFTSFNNPQISTSLETLNKESSQIRIYPNPTTGEINIIKENNLEVQIEIVDLTGKIKFSSTLKNKVTSVDLSDYKPGIYMMRITNQEKIITQKIVKY